MSYSIVPNEEPYRPTYLLQAKQPPVHRFAYIGIPHDSATSIGNPGARFAPATLREAIRGVFDWHLRDGKLADVDEGIVDLSTVEVVDWGDVELTYAETNTIVEESCTAVLTRCACSPHIVFFVG